MESYIRTAIKAAKESGRVLMHYFGRIEGFNYKKMGDLVSKADKQSENKIIQIIEENFPEHSIFSEEAGLKLKDSEFLWIIDPLDGSSNFWLGIPYFSISISLIKDKEIILGVVYNPVLRKLYWAELNKGAFLNDQRLRIQTKRELNKFTVSVVTSYQTPFLAKNVIINLTGKVYRILTNWSPALDFCLLAEGKIDSIISLKPEIEDHPAGILIAREAGAKVKYFDGSEFKLKSFNKYLDNILTISNENLVDKILNIIKDR
ncbi:MAG: inositol monophosphatase [Candidatus Parvarchaeota archaeon]|nr:inositol monophosphatase [Candidatus Haiyanarchaeum thermophilum]MCW1303562.1 inositol monophosphatase [Candidatus Haiyanarchaeum thermophilum]MCW1306244.1 inositol monophosphatase [Candidatus Haiyanarchaeum thermophilum]MCW1307520.1 inositol monophosphatase [Candidatus Haiyanarchaeum thermophilum]MCW1307918.1 inositol monophosphatase [Candidatus Haiyanarchaeum thermophilum]